MKRWHAMWAMVLVVMAGCAQPSVKAAGDATSNSHFDDDPLE
jgi:hypothetical protein